jgi:hypothetical protein
VRGRGIGLDVPWCDAASENQEFHIVRFAKEAAFESVEAVPEIILGKLDEFI